MNILVIGSGGREHAICHSFSKSKRLTRLFCADGNAGIAEIAECVPIKPDDVAGLVEFAASNEIDLTFVGGETSLALGIVNIFTNRGLKIVGPSREAARLEASKSFAKNFMARHRVPTAGFVTAESTEIAKAALESGKFGDSETPVVVKADGLAAGKGVVVAVDRAAAIEAIVEMKQLVGEAAADKIVLEECLTGKEVSLLMFADGREFALMPPTRDHKRIGEGDTGPNTGGMGTFTDRSLLSADELQTIIDTIIHPTLDGCINDGFPFRGILFLGLMMTKGGPKLLEYNVRFGDPETQAILVRLKTDLVEICQAMLGGTVGLSSANPVPTLSQLDIKWKAGSSACIVLASEGYPAQPRVGDVISGVDKAGKVNNVEIFHAGTSHSTHETAPKGVITVANSSLVTSGGRVLGVTATGNDLKESLETAYDAVDLISFEGMQYRGDIGK
ncbi:MAG: phosphoribosylamine--glycine ligase [Pyrinomonadaceae bacterium]